MLDVYLPIMVIIFFALAFALGSVVLSRIVGQRRPNPIKLTPYECGMPPVGSARERLSVKFYIIAMLFILFDIEAVFLVPWAVVFRGVVQTEAYRHLKYVFYGEMMVFMVVLFVGLVYVWRKGILEWNR